MATDPRPIMSSTTDKDHLYLHAAESLAQDEQDIAVSQALPRDEKLSVTAELIQKYFHEGLYPYEDRLPLREYYDLMYPLQVELVKMQNWVKETKQKIVIVFEGRDAAGKGNTIKRFTANLNPRGARVVALEKPTEAERAQWYFQRYVDHLPTAGEIVFFDRSWYNRAGVERVMGFCTDEEYWGFIEQVPDFERMLVRSGIIMFKLYLSVSREEQARRFEQRKTNPLKQWKLSPIDVEAQARWDDYTQAKEETFRLTDTEHAPWTVIKSEDKLRTRINSIQHVLSTLNYSGKDSSIARPPDPLIAAQARLAYKT